MDAKATRDVERFKDDLRRIVVTWLGGKKGMEELLNRVDDLLNSLLLQFKEQGWDLPPEFFHKTIENLGEAAMPTTKRRSRRKVR